MSDQQAPPANGDTPAVAGPTEAPGTAQDQPQDGAGYEQRYKDLQAEYTRSQQTLKELQERDQWHRALVTSDDPDIHRQAIDILGYEPPDDDEIGEGEFEEFDGDTDEITQLRQQLDELKAWKDSLGQEQQQAQENEFIGEWSHAQLDELGIPREDEATRQWIFDRALSLPNLRPSPGMPASWLPDLKTAYEQFEQWRDQQVTNWAKTKRAPHVPAGGLPANEVPNSGTGHEARMARAMRSLHNNMGDEQ